MKKKKRRSILFVHNATRHVVSKKLSNVHVKFCLTFHLYSTLGAECISFSICYAYSTPVLLLRQYESWRQFELRLGSRVIEFVVLCVEH